MSEGTPKGNRKQKEKGGSETRQAFVLAGVVALVAGGIGGAGIYTSVSARAKEQNQQQNQAPATTPSGPLCRAADRAELVPASGALFGVNLDWHAKPLAGYAADLGHKPAVSVSFTGFPYTQQEKVDLQRAVEQIRAHGQMMLLTLEPMNGLASVTPESAAALAADLAEFNDDGVPVIVRFAHEMNGSWYPWSQQPAQYIQAYRTMAEAVHTRAPGSAMMWAPNYGGGYPFAGGQYEAKPGTPDFAALDTDADGVLSMGDDSYAPYYPGDDAVDWVGMSLYHWGADYPWGENEIPEPLKFVDQLTGNYAGANGDDTLLPDFYQVYGEAHGKPVAIPETAALFAPGTIGEAELAIKQAWWSQLFDPATAARFPQLKMINWFEWHKEEVEVKGRVDWTVTNTPAVREAFTTALPDWLHYGPEQSCEPRN
ncbi:glycosyl hydrolase [Arthrobacter sp. Alg241-R88]|uniref:glycoside hydrolase family 26 protein n=1 Tax=Arthrobacter sp. Alg241-R88 TaxID=2305984 RepID=UPI0013D5341C|nr:glycosyl hydrolase [Arthrobacter sp. Alg241-R88]